MASASSDGCRSPTSVRGPYRSKKRTPWQTRYNRKRRLQSINIDMHGDTREDEDSDDDRHEVQQDQEETPNCGDEHVQSTKLFDGSVVTPLSGELAISIFHGIINFV